MDFNFPFVTYVISSSNQDSGVLFHLRLRGDVGRYSTRDRVLTTMMIDDDDDDPLQIL